MSPIHNSQSPLEKTEASDDVHFGVFGHYPRPREGQSHYDRYNVPLDVSQLTDHVKL